MTSTYQTAPMSTESPSASHHATGFVEPPPLGLLDTGLIVDWVPYGKRTAFIQQVDRMEETLLAPATQLSHLTESELMGKAKALTDGMNQILRGLGVNKKVGGAELGFNDDIRDEHCPGYKDNEQWQVLYVVVLIDSLFEQSGGNDKTEK